MFDVLSGQKASTGREKKLIKLQIKVCFTLAGMHTWFLVALKNCGERKRSEMNILQKRKKLKWTYRKKRKRKPVVRKDYTKTMKFLEEVGNAHGDKMRVWKEHSNRYTVYKTQQLMNMIVRRRWKWVHDAKSVNR